MKFLRQSTVALAAAAMLSVGAQQARADIQPSNLSPVVTPCVVSSVNGFCWSYNALLTNGEQLQAGDFFTIYDFGPGSVVSMGSADWTSASSTTNTNPVGTFSTLNITESSALNYTFTYHGTTLLGDQSLGNFVLFSTVSSSQLAAWAASAHDGLHPEVVDVNSTAVNVPTTTPEPATFALLATGMVGLAGFARRRNKSA